MIRFAFLAICSLAYSSSIHSYLEYLNNHYEILGPLGSSDLGEIQIVTESQKIAEIEQVVGRKVGIVAEDSYWIWINDAVIFPSGKYGVYGRMIWRNALSGTSGVVVMPVLSDGKIFLNRNFRHATRSWEYELPRGCVSENETPEEAAIRETKEETGLVVDHLCLLGYVNPDSGMTNSVDPVYLAKILRQEEAQPEDSEAIAGVEAFSLEAIKQGFIDGYLPVELDGKMHRINLRDPFLAFALLQGEIRGLLNKP